MTMQPATATPALSVREVLRAAKRDSFEEPQSVGTTAGERDKAAFADYEFERGTAYEFQEAWDEAV